jgi:hypothetical protein
VSEPLTDFQTKMMGKIYCEVVSKEGINTIPETARKINELWNQRHFALLFGNKQSAGYGGVLTPAIVEKRLMDGHDAQVALQGKEDDTMRSLVMMPNPFTSDESEKMDAESHVLMHKQVADTEILQEPEQNPQKQKKKKPRNVASNKAPPFESLTENDIIDIENGNNPVFSARVLANYCRDLGIAIADSKAQRAERVVSFWRKKYGNKDKNILT